MDSKQHPASYRDPAGFIFLHNGLFHRQVNKSFAEDYSHFISSGLYVSLAKEKKILSHTEIDENLTADNRWYKTLLPEQLGFISYPYEWCFSQWKDAALLTLQLLEKAIPHKMILKDATPFNIQFNGCLPVFIDTLSFEQYDETQPWIAYRQFVECFAAPLLLAAYNGAALLKTFQSFPDGIPLKTLVKLLPFRSRLSVNVLLHIYFPSTVGNGKRNKAGNLKPPPFNKQKLLHIISSLKSLIQCLKAPKETAVWDNYYDETVLSNAYVKEKKQVVGEWMKELPVDTVVDMGCNTGVFAKLASEQGKFVISTDADIACIEKLYLTCKQNKTPGLLPLYLDITNPTPALGWHNEERNAFLSRVNAGLCLALALVHHLAIAKNISFSQLAKTFSQLGPWLIIEFVPKTDEKVMVLLQHRKDIFDDYNEPSFIAAFEKRFTVIKRKVLSNTGRVLFLMQQNSTTANLNA